MPENNSLEKIQEQISEYKRDIERLKDMASSFTLGKVESVKDFAFRTHNGLEISEEGHNLARKKIQELFDIYINEYNHNIKILQSKIKQLEDGIQQAK